MCCNHTQEMLQINIWGKIPVPVDEWPQVKCMINCTYMCTECFMVMDRSKQI